MRHFLAVLLLLVLWTPSARALATNKAPAEAAEAYIALVQADMARDNQEWAKAMDAYRSAIDRYRQLARKNPDWEPDIVKYRLAYCANQVEWAQRKKKAAEEAAQDTDTLAGTDITREKYSALLQENEYIHRCLRELQEQIQEQENTEELKNKLQKLASENVKLRQRLSSADTPPSPVEPEAPTPTGSSEPAAEETAEAPVPVPQPPAEEPKPDRLEELLSAITGPMEPLPQEEPVEITEPPPPEEELPTEEPFPVESLPTENEEPSAPIEPPAPVEPPPSSQEETPPSTEEILLPQESAPEEETQPVEPIDPNADLFAPVPMGTPEPPKPEKEEKTTPPIPPPAAQEPTTAVETNTPEKTVESVAVETNAPPATTISATAGLLHEALTLEQEMKFPEAAEKYRQILALETNQIDALKGQGRCYVQTGNAEQALAILQQASEIEPKDTQVLLLLGMSHCLMRQYHEAIAVLTRAAKLDPKNAYARNTLGAACLSVGDLKTARKQLNLAVRLDPSMSVAYYNLAQVYGFDLPPKLEKAREYYQKALDLGTTPDPEFEKLISYP